MSGKGMFAAAACAAGLALGQGTGEIGGALVEQEGLRPVAGVYVQWTKFADTPRAGADEQRGGMVTRGDGTFAFGGLGAGTYILCALPGARTAWVAPCQWEPNPARIELREGERRLGEVLKLEAGVRLEVGVTDAGGVVERPDKRGQGKWLEVGVAGKGGVHYGMVLLERTGAELRYSLVAPRNERLRLRIWGAGLEVEDAEAKEKGGRLERELGVFGPGQAGPAQRRYVVREAGKR